MASRLILLSLFISIHTNNGAIYNIKYQTPADCRRGEADKFHEFFDFSQLQCRQCSQNSSLQTTSADGLKCTCRSGMKLVQDFGGANIQCEPCPENMVTSSDGWSCVHCENGVDPINNKCNTCQVTNIDGTTESRDIGVERLLNGSWAMPAPTRRCETCDTETAPNSEGTQCFRCNQILSVLPSKTDCTCPDQNKAPGGVCFQSPDDIVEENQNLFKVEFEDDDFESAYLAQNIQAAAGLCKSPYQNITACQQLANMCALILYTRDNEGIRGSEDACALYLLYAKESLGRVTDDWTDGSWPPNMPWLYYLEETGDEILTDKGIPTEYTFPDMKLDLQAAKFSLNGTFHGIQPLTGGILQLCPDSENILDAAYKFGTFYEQSCDIRLRNLWDEARYPLYFYDVYLSFFDGQEEKLYAVPVLITNYKDDNGEFVNQEEDRSLWQLVRRLFLVDNISGKRYSPDPDAASKEIQTIRYAQEIIIHVELQPDTQNGKIYPPYIEVTYAIATSNDYEEDNHAKLTFKVEYRMNLDSYNKDISIAVGVLAALAVAYSGLQVWGWSKRSGKIGIDFIVLSKFVIFCMGNLANVFFVVMFGSSLWWIIFYKRQSVVSIIVPSKDQENRFVAFLASAFVLKFFQLLHLLVCQVTVDIFFIDWERPRGTVVSSQNTHQKNKEASVSIWRTYFVANEWNEIQTIRKISHMFQIFMVLLILNVIGFGNLATTDPYSNFQRSEDKYYSPDSRIFRFAVAALTYLTMAVVQWIFYTFIYERFIEDKVRQYVDLCSLSNISVFILETGQFGYYIHGRSVHGRADTGMKEMAENLKREEENLCGQRGLLPNTEQQTFQVSAQAKLRSQYDKIIRPLYVDQVAAAARAQPVKDAGYLDPRTEKCHKAYEVLNKFLQAFIDHSLRDIDYIIKDKTFLENVLDMEFVDPLDMSYFYNDSGHSFDSVLLFGHENTLIIFEILTFAIIDLLSGSYVLAAVTVYIFMRLFHTLRDGLGRSNIAKKTLIDKRFLI